MKATVVIPNYNNVTGAVRVIDMLLRQTASKSGLVDIVVVDDGSMDDSTAIIGARFGSRISLVSHERNLGRASARNTGAAHAKPDSGLIVFMDADCVPASEDVLTHHLRSAMDSDVVFGPVTARGADFWSVLQERMNEGRRRKFSVGMPWAFTTANVSIRRDVFWSVGGFDPTFDRYGFEDRDLFLRLHEARAKFTYNEEAGVSHEDSLALDLVFRKQFQAGRYGAAAFRARHPDAYRNMPASHLDCALHPWLAPAQAIAFPFAGALARLPEHWLQWRWLPFGLRSLLVRTIYGIAYMRGTRLGSRSGA